MSSALTRAHVRSAVTAAAGDQLSAAFVTPDSNQYEFFDCDQLVATIRASDNAALELRDRISKSGRWASVIGGYETDYAVQRGNVIAARIRAWPMYGAIAAMALIERARKLGVFRARAGITGKADTWFGTCRTPHY